MTNTFEIEGLSDGDQKSAVWRQFFFAIWRLLRPYQWIKNTLVYVPLFAAHQYGDLSGMMLLMGAFGVFNLVSSSAYIINDLLDVEHDRLHPRKKNRPFAAGELRLMVGWILAPLLFCLAMVCCYVFFPMRFMGCLLGYFLLTLAYSIQLKKYSSLDVLVLACLYTLRIIAGGLAISLNLSFWLLTFALLIFLSLAWIKRYIEVSALQRNNSLDVVPGRGYVAEDLHFIAGVGPCAGYLSVLVLALYIQDNTASYLYHSPHLLWLACPLLLYWISYIWLVAYRGMMDDDPILFAVKDKVSLFVAILFITIGVFATIL